MAEPDLPTYRSLMRPVLEVIDEAHGSASKREINEAVVDLVGITDEQLEVTYPDTAQAKGSKVLHRIAFAMSSLKGCDALDNPERGIWTLNARGRSLLAAGDQAIQDADKAYRDGLTVRRLARRAQDNGIGETTVPEPSSDADADANAEAAVIDRSVESAEISWREQVLDRVQHLSPEAFERLCARLLRSAGCRNVEVTSRSGDEGIDGIGVLELRY